MRPRSTRRARGLPYHSTCTRRPGPPRTTSWYGAWSTSNSPRTTCSRACVDPRAGTRRDGATMCPEVPPMNVALVTATNTDVDDSGIGPGLLGFLVLLALCVALFVLYRSLRRQLKRIDFDPQGRTDAERMRDDDGNDSR